MTQKNPRYTETVLSVVPGATEDQRLVVVLRALHEPTPKLHVPEAMDVNFSQSRPFCHQVTEINERPVVLRQESFSPAVGWFTQSTLEMTSQQWHAMRSTVVPSSPTSRRKSQPASATEQAIVVPFRARDAVSA